MKKINLTASILIALSVLCLFISAVFFQFYTFNENGDVLGDWRSNESMMYLGTAKIISLIAGIAILAGIVLFFIGNDKLTGKQNVIVILLTALSAFTIIGTFNFFYPCTDMMKMNDRPMRCYWTMKALLGLSGAISVCGVLMLLSCKSKDIIKGLNYAIIMLSCLFVLTPIKITEGFCSSMSGSHPCLERFYPFTFMIGCLILILSLINAFLLYKNTKQKA